MLCEKMEGKKERKKKQIRVVMETRSRFVM
jgi:hypothetical protein